MKRAGGQLFMQLLVCGFKPLVRCVERFKSCIDGRRVGYRRTKQYFIDGTKKVVICQGNRRA